MADDRRDRGTPEEYDPNIGVTEGSQPVNPAGPSAPTFESRRDTEHARHVGQTTSPEAEWAAQTAATVETAHSGEGGGALGTEQAGLAAGGQDDPVIGPRDAENNAGNG